MSDLKCANLSFWVNKEILLPCLSRNMCVDAVWNTAAYLPGTLFPNNHKSTWIRDLARDNPEANWKHEYIDNDSLLMSRY